MPDDAKRPLKVFSSTGSGQAFAKVPDRVRPRRNCTISQTARDVARLMAGGYRLKQVTPCDLFPQTYPIESIGIFTWA